MNNFTKSSGNAYWHAITNLTCCSIDLTKMRMFRTLMVLMLFAFSTSMFAQSRTTFYEVCVEDRPEGLTEEQALALFPGMECDGTLSVVKTEDLQGDDCGWVTVYTYTLFCDEEELANEKLMYEGGDVEAPKLEVPADVTVECDSIPEPGTPSATDNCDDDVDITYDGEIRIGDDDCMYQLQRTWTATDACGLTHTVSQIITVQDTEGPKLNKGAEIPTGETGLNLCYNDRPEGPSEADIAALFSDNCGDVVVEKEPVFKGTDCMWKGYINYYITDSCGNPADTISLYYNGGDNEAPVFVDPPADITVSCIDLIPSNYKLQWTDNCSVSDPKGKGLGVDDTSGLGEACEGGVMTRTWTAQDDCGNEVTHTQTITVEAAPPVMFDELEDLEIKCEDLDAFEPGQLYYSNGGAGACDINGYAQGVAEDFKENCGSFTVTYTYEDTCNSITHVQTITVIDDVAPELIIPADDRVECDSVPAIGEATASDNCDNEVDIKFDGEERIDGNCADSYTLLRTWTAEDNCGNTTTLTQTITVVDETAPELTIPADETVECNMIPEVGQASATDNCDDEVEVVYQGEERVDGDCEDNYTLIRVWRAEDNCGNSTTLSQIITVVDTTAPELTIPADETVECDSVPAVGEASATDNCDGDVDIKFDGEVRKDGECADSYSLERTWTATDNCGNETSLTQIITVVDTTAPDLTIPADETAECDDLPEVGQAYATDNCDAEVDVVYNGEERTDGACENSYTLTRTWTATDNCGNATTLSQTISVVDTTAPEITVPDDVTVECNEVPEIGDASATDNCDDDVKVEFLKEERIDGDCEDNYRLVRIWRAEDNCGNFVTGSQTITVQDTTAPELTIPADDRAECHEVPAVGQASATDNCDAEVTVTYDGEQREDGNCEDSYTLIRTWTATDNCGNSTTKSQIISIYDETAPDLTIPADETVECDSVPAVGEASATDNCDADVDIKFDGEVRKDGECADSYSLERTWTATDNCGNETSLTQIITVVDTTAPDLTVPADETAECDDLPEVGQAYATDNCDAEVDVNYDGEQRVDGSCEDSYTLIRTWTATDNCGNSTTVSQTITVVDTTAPDLTIPADETVECDSVPAVGQAYATDNCDDEVDIKFDGEVRKDGECEDSYSLERTWTATDNCGNETSLTQIITVVDTTAPEITVPADDAVDCAAVPEPGTATGVDNCDSDVEIRYDGEVRTDGDCPGNYTLVRTWTAIDNCGNETSDSQTITVTDKTAPAENETFELPESKNEINACQDEYLDPPMTEEEFALMFTDDCSNVVVDLFSSPVGNDCGWSIIHIYTVSDDCGNLLGDYKVYYSGEDMTNPELVGVPADELISCTDEVPAPANVTATDNCDDDVKVEYSEQRVEDNDEDCNNYDLIRTWTATDECGNSVSASQTIQVRDMEAPVLTGDLPEESNQNDMCAPETEDDLAALGILTADDFALLYTDDCNAVVVNREVNLDGDDCKWILWVRYDIADSCGNEAQSVKLWYHGGDFSAPEPTGLCENETMDLPSSQTGVCPADATITYDAEITSEGGVFTVAGVEFNHSNLKPCFMDNCATQDELTFVVVGTDEGDDKETCSRTMTITFDVYDNCENAYEGFVCTFVILDDEAPVITKADDVTVECGDGNEAAFEAWLADNGGHTAEDCNDVTWTNDYNACGQEFTNGFLTSADDFSGNEELLDININGLQDVTGEEWASQGVHFTSPSGIEGGGNEITPKFFGGPGSIVLNMNFDSKMNRVGFNIRESVNIDTEITIKCMSEGNVIDVQVVDATEGGIFWGMESEAGFDAVVLESTIDSDLDRFILSNIRFEGCDTEAPEFGQSNECSYSTTVTFYATDACGNVSETTSTFTVEDTIAPEFVDADCGETIKLDFDPNNGPGYKAGFTMLGEYNGNYYYLSDAAMPATEALPNALANGGHAVTINDEAENTWVYNAVVAAAGGNIRYYIGYTDTAQEGVFVWQDGDTSTYTNWHAGEPNNAGSEDCAEVGFFGSSTWNDINCVNQSNRYVLEVKGASLKEKAAYTDACAGDGEITQYYDSQVTYTVNNVNVSINLGIADGPVSNGRAGYVGIALDENDQQVGDSTYELYWTDHDDWHLKEITQGGQEIYQGYTWIDGPSCDFNDWGEYSILTGVICDENGLTLTATIAVSENSFTRTFTAYDGCNESECVVTYAWDAQDYQYSNNGIDNDGPDYVHEGQSAQAAPDQGDDMGIELDFLAYPVPFDRDVNVKFNFEFDTDVTINVHDTRGLLVKSLSLTNVRAGSEVTKSFDLSRAGDQLFYITVTTNQGSVTKKVVSSNMKRR